MRLHPQNKKYDNTTPRTAQTRTVSSVFESQIDAHSPKKVRNASLMSPMPNAYAGSKLRKRTKHKHALLKCTHIPKVADVRKQSVCMCGGIVALPPVVTLQVFGSRAVLLSDHRHRRIFGFSTHARKGLAQQRASYSSEIALSGSRHMRSMLAAAPVLFAHAAVAVATNK